MRRVLVVVAAMSLAACSKTESSTGLAPAQDWGAAQSTGGGAAAPGNNPHATDPDNPHAGLGLNAQGEPEADGTATNPHAGLGMASGDDPHAGMAGGGVDVSKLGLPPPDPNRAIDPSRFVKGVITLGAKSAAHVKAGGVIFIVVKRSDATGQPTGTPLAVDKLTWQPDKLAFELGEQQAMVGGTQLTGDVIVQAHYAQDGDALSKAAGDVLGQTRVTIPADHVSVVLDKVLD
ncbi:MAG TPA: hypothetical protein VH143_17280 [Kofleriaceae bacterium]|nr:hypothetical protein [Kofleriaceae bacterium]